MGLTIHYDLMYAGKDPTGVLEKLRQKAMDLPFAEISEVVYYFKGRAADYQNHSRESEFTWPLIQAVRYIEYPPYSIGVTPKEVYMFTTWPGEECEEANFGFARYPAAITFQGKRLRTGLNSGWRWGSFCKTQYASKVSAEHFLRCHSTVCHLLKEAGKLGILAGVNDEGGFWDRWDFEALAREVGDWNAMIASTLKRLRAQFGDGTIVSPIDDIN